MGLRRDGGGDGVGEGFLRPIVIGLVDVGDSHHIAATHGDGAVAGSGGLVIVGSDASGVIPGIGEIHGHRNSFGVPGRGGYRQVEGALGQIGVGHAHIKRVAGSEIVHIYGVSAVGEPKIAGAGLTCGCRFECTQVLVVGKRCEHRRTALILRRIREGHSSRQDLYHEGYIRWHCHGESALVVGAVTVDADHFLGTHVHRGYHGSRNRVALAILDCSDHVVPRRGRREDADIHGYGLAGGRCVPNGVTIGVRGSNTVIEPGGVDLHLELGAYRQRDFEHAVRICTGSAQWLGSTSCCFHRQGDNRGVLYRCIVVIVHLADDLHSRLPMENAYVIRTGGRSCPGLLLVGVFSRLRKPHILLEDVYLEGDSGIQGDLELPLVVRTIDVDTQVLRRIVLVVRHDLGSGYRVAAGVLHRTGDGHSDPPLEGTGIKSRRAKRRRRPLAYLTGILGRAFKQQSGGQYINGEIGVGGYLNLEQTAGGSAILVGSQYLGRIVGAHDDYLGIRHSDAGRVLYDPIYENRRLSLENTDVKRPGYRGRPCVYITVVGDREREQRALGVYLELELGSAVKLELESTVGTSAVLIQRNLLRRSIRVKSHDLGVLQRLTGGVLNYSGNGGRGTYCAGRSEGTDGQIT